MKTEIKGERNIRLLHCDRYIVLFERFTLINRMYLFISILYRDVIFYVQATKL